MKMDREYNAASFTNKEFTAWFDDINLVMNQQSNDNPFALVWDENDEVEGVYFPIETYKKLARSMKKSIVELKNKKGGKD
ncbi:hypothetical protein [uncultured Limosilactobacillus sp.]|uniref:hypothetical protein n=1 Tax=uncultured Limosilactobacillus sp. TaxID=2837629 RepID=UPI0025E295DC|nr:hypothetical protein [uncultured Limosilactobacillus sp.]